MHVVLLECIEVSLINILIIDISCYTEWYVLRFILLLNLLIDTLLFLLLLQLFPFHLIYILLLLSVSFSLLLTVSRFTSRQIVIIATIIRIVAAPIEVLNE